MPFVGALLVLGLAIGVYATRAPERDRVELAETVDSPAAAPTVSEPGPIAATGPETISNNTTNPPEADLHDDLTCEVDEIGWVVAKGTLTNRSSETSGYMLHVSFNDAASVRFAEGSAFHNDVRAGESLRWGTFPAGRAPEGDSTCEIVSIERFASQ